MINIHTAFDTILYSNVTKIIYLLGGSSWRINLFVSQKDNASLSYGWKMNQIINLSWI